MSSCFSVENRNVLVTGGTRGIGKAVTLQFARSGATIIANYVRAQKTADALLAQAREEQLRITLCRADLTLEKGQQSLEETVAGIEGGVLHSLIHCAATGIHKPFEELTLRHYDWTFALNVRAFFDLVQRLLPRFSADASIVAVSSQGAVRALPGYSLVGSSKAALEALARHMAVELAPRGIRVNILAPGAIETEAWDAMPEGKTRLAELARRTPVGRLTTPEEVAQVAQFLCSDAARTMIGQTLVVDGGAGIPV
jgi:enoyl-[acyl-carrier protein] reductase III